MSIRKSNLLCSAPVVIFDLDGVLVQNPTAAMQGVAIQDHDFWEKHWSDSENAKPYDDMIMLAETLLCSGYAGIILTARPVEFWRQTVDFLALHFIQRCIRDIPLYDPADGMQHLAPGRFALQMRPEEDGITDGRQWKHDMIKSWLDGGMNIQFMVEDYKPNADAVRKLIPVLLYERKKP